MKRILIVDDEKPSRDTIGAMVRALGHQPVPVGDGREALAEVRQGIDLVLMDVGMPGTDGFEVTRRIRQDLVRGDVPIIVVTGLAEEDDRLRAVSAGANDFIAKPVRLTELRVRTASLLAMKEARDALKRHERELEEMVLARTVALQAALQEMAEAQRRTHDAQLDTIQRLALAAELKDQVTAAHIQRISDYCALLARGLGLPPNEVETLRVASPMHDVGKISVPDAILLRPGRLTPNEWEIMKQHALAGARILDGSTSELLQAGRLIALTHHERWDGSGYPRGLIRQEIPLFGRICAVADVFDAITSDRPYRKALSNEDALEILRAGRARQLDPMLVDLFVRNLEEVIAIQEKHRVRRHERERDWPDSTAPIWTRATPVPSLAITDRAHGPDTRGALSTSLFLPGTARVRP